MYKSRQPFLQSEHYGITGLKKRHNKQLLKHRDSLKLRGLGSHQKASEGSTRSGRQLVVIPLSSKACRRFLTLSSCVMVICCQMHDIVPLFVCLFVCFWFCKVSQQVCSSVCLFLCLFVCIWFVCFWSGQSGERWTLDRCCVGLCWPATCASVPSPLGGPAHSQVTQQYLSIPKY